MFQHRRRHWVTVLIGLCFTLLVTPVMAQDGIPQPINARSATTGEITLLQPVARFVLSTPDGDTINLQLLGIGTGFVPRIRILDTTSSVIFEATATSNNSITEEIVFEPGAYIIEVMGDGGSAGQFVLMLSAGVPLAPPQALIPGRQVRIFAGSAARYSFNDAGLRGETLSIQSESADTGPAYRIVEVETGREIAVIDETMPRVIFTLRGNGSEYLVEISSEATNPNMPFTLCLACTSATATPTPVPTATEPPPTATPVVCNVVSTSAGNAYVRSGPDFDFNAVGILRAGQSVLAIAQTSNEGWFQVNLNGVIGWVGSSVARLDGDCADLPVLNGG